jgi:site-specific DNA recombinase
VGAEIDRRIQASQKAEPTVRRKDALRKEHARVQKNITRLLDAYQEELLPLEELRPRMVALRKRQQAVQAELNSLEDQAIEKAHYLRLAESMTDFLSQLQANADTLDVTDRQKILRLLVKEILVDDDTITIRHAIPITGRGGLPSPSGGGETPSYLLRSGSH